MVSMTFNGVDLSDDIVVMSAPREIGNNRTLNVNDTPDFGNNVNSVKIDNKTIPVNFYLKDRSDEYALNRLKHKLAGVFNVTKAVKITFSDEPDKYYMGLPVNKISVDDPIAWLSLVTLELYIPDGVAHSLTYRRFVDYRKEDGKIFVPLDNNGTINALPIVTVKNNQENGYLGMVNETGVFEMGNREELDGKIVFKSEQLFDYTGESITQGFAAAQKNVGITNNSGFETNRVVSKITNVWGRNHVVMDRTHQDHSNDMTTSSLTFEIPADSKGEVGSLNDYIWWRQIFWAGTTRQYGFLKVSVSDADDKFLYGVETFKRSFGTKSEYNVVVSDGQGGYEVKATKTFEATHADTQNPFNQNRGWADIARSDNKISYYWFGSRFEVDAPGIQGKLSKKIHVTFGAYGFKEFMTHMYLDGIKYRKDKMSFEEDIPNRYSQGSKLVVNSENNSVKVDELNKLDERVIGSSFLTIPTGKSELELHLSSWVETDPTIEVEFEERYL